MLQCASVVLPLTRLPGAAPELNPGWVRRRKNTCPEVRYATHRLLKTNEQAPLNTLCHAMTSTPQIKNFQEQLAHVAACKCCSSLNTPSWRDAGAAPSMASLATTPAHCSRSLMLFSSL